MSAIINKLKLAYGTVASFNILMHFFLQITTEEYREGDSICNLIGGGTECGSTGIPYNLSASKVQKHLRDHFFHGLCKLFCDSMHYLYDDQRIMYPQLMTVACKAES